MSFDYIDHCFFVIFVLIIWFKTEAFVEYARLFGLSKLLEIDKFDDRTIHELTYSAFLLVNRDNFLTRLISCPICLGVWVNILVCLFFRDFRSPFGLNFRAFGYHLSLLFSGTLLH